MEGERDGDDRGAVVRTATPVDLIRDGTVSFEAMGVLWRAVEAGRSVAVLGPSTTDGERLLGALPYFVRAPDPVADDCGDDRPGAGDGPAGAGERPGPGRRRDRPTPRGADDGRPSRDCRVVGVVGQGRPDLPHVRLATGTLRRALDGLEYLVVLDAADDTWARVVEAAVEADLPVAVGASAAGLSGVGTLADAGVGSGALTDHLDLGVVLGGFDAPGGRGQRVTRVAEFESIDHRHRDGVRARDLVVEGGDEPGTDAEGDVGTDTDAGTADPAEAGGVAGRDTGGDDGAGTGTAGGMDRPPASRRVGTASWAPADAEAAGVADPTVVRARDPDLYRRLVVLARAVADDAGARSTFEDVQAYVRAPGDTTAAFETNRVTLPADRVPEFPWLDEDRGGGPLVDPVDGVRERARRLLPGDDSLGD